VDITQSNTNASNTKWTAQLNTAHEIHMYVIDHFTDVSGHTDYVVLSDM
jgi:hypothetical protein